MKETYLRRLGGALIASALVLGASATAGAAPAPTTACPQNDGTRCLKVTVPLDRSGELRDTINLNVRIAPATSGRATETILLLGGGPGQEMVGRLPGARASFPASVVRTRQVVAFDQRGTGESGRIFCPRLGPVIAPPDPVAVQQQVAECAELLGPARSHYATIDTLKDIEAVRTALGVDRLIVDGGSYGTKVALDYAAAYPQHVSRLILDSVVPQEGSDPFGRSTIAAIPRIARSNCVTGCPFTQDPAADMAALAQRLLQGPLAGPLVLPDGTAVPFGMVQPHLLALLLNSDVSPFQRALLPGAVKAALNEDPALLLRLLATPVGGVPDPGDSDTLFLATRCEDGIVPWAPGTPIADRPAAVEAALAAVADRLAPFHPFSIRAIGLADMCDQWPESPVEQPHGRLPNVPTLILTGEADVRAPIEDAFAVGAQIPASRVIVVPATGHGTVPGDAGTCTRDSIADFFNGAKARQCALPPLNTFRKPGAPPAARLADLRPLGSFRNPAAGQTLAAVGQTIDVLQRLLVADMAGQNLLGRKLALTQPFSSGGLRGGTASFTRLNDVKLRGYSVVPGVALEGSINETGNGLMPLDVRVDGGANGVRGSVHILGDMVIGVLGGQAFAVNAKQFPRIGVDTAK